MKYVASIMLSLLSFAMKSQNIIPLYPGEIPNSKKSSDQEKTETKDGVVTIRKISNPTVTIFLPKEKGTPTAAVIICPGGGYWVNAYRHEGTEVAEKFAEKGIAAFVVKYRIPESRIMETPAIGPLQDAQQAIKLVRENAKRWNIDPKRVGMLGFSAGGHMVSTAGTHYKEVTIENPRKTNLRPDFMLLIYPVISLQKDIGHPGSKEKLLGKTADKKLIDRYSNELHITAQTPPTFLVHAKDDDIVNADNSIRFDEKLKKAGVASELFLFEKGGHGFGLHNTKESQSWFDQCINWMTKMKFMK